MTIRDWTEAEPGKAPSVAMTEGLTPRSLVELYADDVWRYASSKLRRREDAEDAAMETFAHAIRDWSRLSRAQSPRLWLLAVARNKVHDVMRRSYRRAETSLDDSLPAPQIGESESREPLHEALADLPKLYREVLVLKYVNGLSVEEIAKVIRKSPAAVNSLLQRSRAALRERAQHLIEAQGGPL